MKHDGNGSLFLLLSQITQECSGEPWPYLLHANVRSPGDESVGGNGQEHYRLADKPLILPECIYFRGNEALKVIAGDNFV